MREWRIYVAERLSSGIQDGTIKNIELGQLSEKELKGLIFAGEELKAKDLKCTLPADLELKDISIFAKGIRATSPDWGYSVSLFRYKK
jgi:hypothetical protein